tara:strand:+ start:3170 stop:4960 length:1791 start_codon:yes stop_codon:yes gene_type:complete
MTSLATFSGYKFYDGQRTVIQNPEGQASVVRTMESGDQANELMLSGCIALPSGFSGELSVSFSGTSHDLYEDTDIEFISVAESFDSAELTTALPLTGYEWHCYEDSERHYAATNRSSVEFAFTPESDDQLIFTSLGFKDADLDDSFKPFSYLENLQSHQLIAPGIDAAHWDTEELDTALGRQGINTNEAVYYLVDSGHDGEGNIIKLDENGFNIIGNTPVTGDFYYLNDRFFILTYDSYYYTENPESWIGPIQRPITSNIYDSFKYDELRNKYLMLGHGNRGYESEDLVNWQEMEDIPQNVYPRFIEYFTLDNGVSLSCGIQQGGIISVRSSAEANWNPLTDLPESILNTGGNYAGVSAFQDKDDSVEVIISGNDNSGNNSYWYGTTSTGSDWRWSLTPVQFDYSLSSIEKNQNYVVLWGNYPGADIVYSDDDGMSWQSKNTNDLLADFIGSDISQYAYLTDVVSVGDMFYLNIRLYDISGVSYPDLVISTSDFSSFSLIAAEKNGVLVSIQDKYLYWYKESSLYDLFETTKAYQYYTPPQTDSLEEQPAEDQNPDSDDSQQPDEQASGHSSHSGGSLFWLSLVLLPLAGVRKKAA